MVQCLMGENNMKTLFKILTVNTVTQAAKIVYFHANNSISALRESGITDFHYVGIHPQYNQEVYRSENKLFYVTDNVDAILH